MHIFKSLHILSSLNFFQIGEITESPDTEYMSTSAILHYCKSKVGRLIQKFLVSVFIYTHAVNKPCVVYKLQILLPYLKLLTIMGLRPVVDVSNSSKCAVCFSHFHSAQVAILMFVGYILQYMACFRFVTYYYYYILYTNTYYYTIYVLLLFLIFCYHLLSQSLL